jgi:tetratricopeptide (TPR) repeat protein
MHVTEEHLRQLAENRLPVTVRARVVRHLLTACRPCLELARRVLFPELEEVPDYSGVLRRLELAGVLALEDVAVERRVARELWDHHLARLAPGPRRMAIRSNPDLHTWGTFEQLLDEARKIEAGQPLESLDLTHDALAVADLLAPESYGEDHVHDLRAEAWAFLGNLKRRAGDFSGAEEALRAAVESLERGSEDPYLETNVLSMTASLLTDLGELEKAADLLEGASLLARSVRDHPLEGRLRIQQAGNIGLVDPARGLKLAERGLRLLRRSKSEDRHTELGGVHIMTFCTNEIGETEEARATLETYRFLYEAFPDPATQGRLLLLDGLICRNEGRLEASERLLRRLVEHYGREGLDFDLTLATLEWAEALVLLGRHREAAGVLREVYPLIEQWGGHVDILRAWKIVEEAVRRQAAHREAFRELAMTVRRRWLSVSRTAGGP